MDTLLPLFTTTGRIGRRTYALIAIPLIFIWTFAAVGDWALAVMGIPPLLPPLVSSVSYWGSLWLLAAASGKRFHDRGLSAWWALLLVIPLVNFAAVLAGLIAPAKPSGDFYGPNPRDAKALAPASAEA